jgi:hypothetical protein
MFIVFLVPILFPILTLPLIIGIYLLTRASAFTFVRMLGVLTLKPIVATPLWLMIIAALGEAERAIVPNDFFLLAAPGIVLTIVILIIYRSTLRPAFAAHLTTILILDALRWASSSFAFVSRGAYGGAALGLLCFAMPTIFALVALWFARSYLKHEAERAAAHV